MNFAPIEIIPTILMSRQFRSCAALATKPRRAGGSPQKL
jgi:hypothetical protein